MAHSGNGLTKLHADTKKGFEGSCAHLGQRTLTLNQLARYITKQMK